MVLNLRNYVLISNVDVLSSTVVFRVTTPANSMAPTLSWYTTVESCGIHSSSNICWRENVIRVACDSATYSASVELRVTPVYSVLEVCPCAEEYVVSIPLLLRLSDPSSPPQFESTYTVKCVELPGDSRSGRSLVPFPYRSVLISVFKWWFNKRSTRDPRKLAAIAISVWF